MSQTSKRPGARDISDLKARLGLKKTGDTPAVTAPQPPPGGGIVPPPGGGIVPPPGAQAPHVPAPPGVTAPVAPAPPGVMAPDPFGGTAPQIPVAPQQDIIVVNDGQPVESVAKSSKGASIGKIAVMVMAPLVAGVIIGKMSANAGQYNQVIEDAEPIAKDVKKVRSALTDLKAILEAGQKGETFTVGDEAMTKSLTELVTKKQGGEAKKAEKKEGEGGDTRRGVLEGDDKLVFQSSLFHLKWQTASSIYGFYSDLHTLNKLIRAHVRASRLEAKILSEAEAKLNGINPKGFAAVLTMPAEGTAPFPTIKMVQLGAPVCAGQTKANPEGCGGGPMAGFQHRDDQQGGWKTASLAPTTPEGEWDGSVLPMEVSKTLQQAMQGGEAVVANTAYITRIKAINSLAQQLIDTSGIILKVLGEKADEGGKFTFFL